jgi:hypothetical protein
MTCEADFHPDRSLAHFPFFPSGLRRRCSGGPPSLAAFFGRPRLGFSASGWAGSWEKAWLLDGTKIAFPAEIDLAKYRPAGRV